MDYQKWGLVVQVIYTLVTFIGVMLSLYMSIKSIKIANKSLKQAEIDRHLRHRPYLFFDGGGHRRTIEFVKAGRHIPGKNPEYVEKVFASLPEDAESIRLVDIKNNDGSVKIPTYGFLRNYGTGPALNVEVTWIAEVIWIGNEKFILDPKKMKEPQYDVDLNTYPTMPENIFPEKFAQMINLPIFIEKDYTKKINRVDGYFRISYCDIFDTRYVTKQEFHIFTGYTKEDQYFHVTFLDIRKDDSENIA